MWSLLSSFFEGMKENLVDVVTPWVDVLFALVATPFEFDWVSTFLTFFQAVAVVIIFVIVMVRGVTSGIFGEASGQGEGPLLYLMRSFVPIFLVAATPSIVGAVTSVTTGMVRSFAASSSGGFATSLVDSIFSIMAGSNPLVATPALVTSVVLVVMLYYLITVCAQCLSRWVMLAVYSIITPLTCIFTAVEDSSDYVTILKSMAYTGVVTVIQLLLLQSATAMPGAGSSIMSGVGAVLSVDSDTLALMGSVMLTIAVLGSAKQVPNWIEKFTAAPSVAGRGNVGRMVPMAVRTATSVVRSAAARG